MPPRTNYSNPAPQTAAARAQLANFTCTLCNKTYARQNEFAAHEMSYEHNHNKRRRDLSKMTVNLAGSSGKKKKKSKEKPDVEMRDVEIKTERRPVTGFKPLGGTKRDEGGDGETRVQKEEAVAVSAKEGEKDREESDSEDPGYEYYDPVVGTACGPACQGLCAG